MEQRIITNVELLRSSGDSELDTLLSIKAMYRRVAGSLRLFASRQPAYQPALLSSQ